MTLSLLLSLLAAIGPQEQAEPDQIVATEIFYVAPSSTAVQMAWSCDENAATLSVSVPSSVSEYGGREFAEPTVWAALNGNVLADEEIADLEALIIRVGRLPHIIPFCRNDRPGITVQEESRVERWAFPRES